MRWLIFSFILFSIIISLGCISTDPYFGDCQCTVNECTDNENAEKITVKLDQYFIIYEGQTVVIEGENLEITATNFVYSPCPSGVMCIWSGVGIFYDFKKDGKPVDKVDANPEKLGYAIMTNCTNFDDNKALLKVITYEEMKRIEEMNAPKNNITIKTSKDTYAVNEHFKASYNIKTPEARDVRYLIEYKEGDSEPIHRGTGMVQSDIDGASGGLSIPVMENGKVVDYENSFKSEGEYSFIIKIYECSDINEFFNRTDCLRVVSKTESERSEDGGIMRHITTESVKTSDIEKIRENLKESMSLTKKITVTKQASSWWPF